MQVPSPSGSSDCQVETCTTQPGSSSIGCGFPLAPRDASPSVVMRSSARAISRKPSHELMQARSCSTIALPARLRSGSTTREVGGRNAVTSDGRHGSRTRLRA